MTIEADNCAAYRVAVIGYGIGGAVFHAPLVSAVPGLNLSAIVTRSAEKTEQARRDWPQAKIIGSAEEVFAGAKDYDLVVITSPNRYHYSQAKAALEAGLHVVIDKPMATNSQHCLELIALAKKQNRLLTVFHNRRLDGDFLTIQKIMQEDLLGQIVRFESRFERYRPQPKPGAWRELGSPEDGGGLLLDLGSHLIDQACHLFGRPQELDRRREGVAVDDDCFVALSFASGVRAHLWSSVLCRIKGPRFRLLGHRGSFEKYGMDPQEEALRAGMRPSVTAGAQAWGRDEEALWGSLNTEVDGLVVQGKIETLPGSYPSFYEDLLAALRAVPGAAPPVDPQDAWQTATILEAALRSSEQKTVVRI